MLALSRQLGIGSCEGQPMALMIRSNTPTPTNASATVRARLGIVNGTPPRAVRSGF